MKNGKLKITAIFSISVFILLGFAFTTMSNDDVVEERRQSGLIRGYSYEELLHETPVIILGQIEEVNDPIQIRHASGNMAVNNYTDHIVSVDKVIRGDLNPNDSLVLRIEGGEVNNLRVVSEDAPVLPIGDKCLFFLYQPNMGGSYNTKGDYYYVVGVNQGVFVENENVYSNPAQISFTLEKLNNDLNSMTEEETKQAMDKNRIYNEFKENQKYNLDNNVINKEEYDRLLLEAKTYATIVK